MSDNPKFFGLALADWAAIATIVNGLTVLILVGINVLYLKSANRQAAAALRQAEAAFAQAKEGQRQADAASESLQILKGQLSERNHRELVRAIAILNEMKLNVMFWSDITDNKWGTAPETVQLLPDDWSVILLQAGRVSPELRNEVLEAFRMIGNAQYQISSFLSKASNYRDPQLMPPAHGNLINAMPKLVQICSALQLAEEKASASAIRA